MSILPYETRGTPSFLFEFVGDGMFGSLSLAYNASYLSSLAPPLRGDLISLHHDLRSRLTVKRMIITSMKAHDELI